MSALAFFAEEICSTLMANENTICCSYRSLIISFARGFDAYPRLIFATQVVLSVNKIYFFLVHSLLKVETAIIIAISSLRLMSMTARFKLQLHREIKKYSSNVTPAPMFDTFV